MYYAVVKRFARRNFLGVNQKEFDALLKDCAPDIRHRFGGDHALGGERHGREALRRWLGRLGRRGRHRTLTGEDVWVKGLPHDTTIIIRWSATDILPDGSPYRNRGVHIVRMRWGKAVDIDAHEDALAVARNLDRQAALGIEEAGAMPILA